MSHPHDSASTPQRDPGAGAPPASSSSNNPSRNQPLVIVSEHGRHSEAARRIVRAQAARASAAQSRETRARNREDRHQREGPQSPPGNGQVNQRSQQHSQQQQRLVPPRQYSNQRFEASDGRTQTRQRNPNQAENDDSSKLKPLVNWITNVLKLSAQSFAAGAAVLASTGRPQLSNASDVLYRAGGVMSDGGEAMQEVEVAGGLFSRQLPIALPRGFVALQKRIQISDAYLVLLSRTACFDFGSPGVEDRLNELLYDIVMTSATTTLPISDQSGHPIELHLRIACTCLTIFQGQRADGQSFAYDQKYNNGLLAAWEEVVVLDQGSLREPNSAEAALWAVFIISVTCGATATFFHTLISGLMQDLQLRYWNDVRTVLLKFIYPGSFLDEPSRQFFDKLQSGPMSQALPG